MCVFVFGKIVQYCILVSFVIPFKGVWIKDTQFYFTKCYINTTFYNNNLLL